MLSLKLLAAGLLDQCFPSIDNSGFFHHLFLGPVFFFHIVIIISQSNSLDVQFALYVCVCVCVCETPV